MAVDYYSFQINQKILHDMQLQGDHFLCMDSIDRLRSSGSCKTIVLMKKSISTTIKLTSTDVSDINEEAYRYFMTN